MIPERESFILKQYWLSQVIFYLIYKEFGDIGIIVLRALIFLIITMAILWRLIKNNVRFYLCFVFIFLVHITTFSFTPERPVLFTMLFSVFVFLLLEEFRLKKTKLVFLLVPLMLLWANMHGGFILGDLIIGVFIVGITISILFNKRLFTKKELIIFYSVCLSAIAISALNPNNFSAIVMVMSKKYDIFRENIQEHLSPILLYKNNVRKLDIGYITLAALYPIVIIFRGRKMHIAHIILISILVIMSIIAIRFMIYFLFIGAIILGTEIDYLLKEIFKRGISVVNQQRIESVFIAAIFLSTSLFFYSNAVNFRGVRFNKAISSSVPEKAVNFIEENHLSGNLYNDFVFGGYVTWRLYPWKKNFIDTRSINYTVLSEARWINFAKKSLKSKVIQSHKAPLWERLLDHYNIDIILLDTLNVHGLLPPIIFKLLKNKKWVPVYVDNISVIFIRDKRDNQKIIEKYRLENKTVLTAIMERAIKGALNNKENPYFFISLGNIYYHTGRFKDAVIAYSYAIERLPKDNPVRVRIEEIEKQLKLK